MVAAPAGDDDGLRGIQCFETRVDGYPKASQCMHRSWIDGNDLMAIPRYIQLRAGQAEDLQGDTKLEHAKAFINEDCHGSGMRMHLA
ncbi:hypothetical protein D3C75_1257720 [compost metagenome]